MPNLVVGSLADLTHTRYVIHLSDGKRLVLFRLPTIEGSGGRAKAKNDSNDGWSYYAMEAECPHAGGPMQDAHVDIEDSAYIASCPWHAYDFNVETGESSVGIKACTFPIDVRRDAVILTYPGDVCVSKLEPVSETIKLKSACSEPTVPAEAAPAKAQYLDDNATLCDWCTHILNTGNAEHKIELTAHLFSIFTKRERTSSPMTIIGSTPSVLPATPPRDKLVEVEPKNMPNNGRGGTLKSRIAMLHALANIEQWAIDLAIDICVRFAEFQTSPQASESARQLPRTFFHDWLKVANDEAKHFSLLRTRLEEMGSYFGALPVHHGLWESATKTAHDLRARISIIALVHEARGLDVNPMTIAKFRNARDDESVKALEVIHNDEITHVTTGHRWLTWICQEEKTDPVDVFRSNVRKYFVGGLKEPFNREDRAMAGLDARYYDNLGISTRPGAGSPVAAMSKPRYIHTGRRSYNYSRMSSMDPREGSHTVGRWPMASFPWGNARILSAYARSSGGTSSSRFMSTSRATNGTTCASRTVGPILSPKIQVPPWLYLLRSSTTSSKKSTELRVMLRPADMFIATSSLCFIWLFSSAFIPTVQRQRRTSHVYTPGPCGGRV
ncbi:hypothetical protein BDV18DRAFT_135375 [Aspergillus unguis]